MSKISRFNFLLLLFDFLKKYPLRRRFWILKDYLSLYKKKFLTFDEYYNFEFDKKDEYFKDTFLGITEKRFYIDLLNPIFFHCCSRDKYITHKIFEEIGIKTSTLYCYYQPIGEIIKTESDTIIANTLEDVIKILKRQNVSSFVIKLTNSSHGNGVEVIKNIEYQENNAILTKYNGEIIKLSDILANIPLIFENVIQQTKQISKFNSSSINTVRFMTTLWPNGDAKIIATFIKIGRIGRCVDNAGSGGNIDAGIDIESGKIFNAIQFDGWRKTKEIEIHPDSKYQLNGVIIDNWESIKEEVKKFQKAFPYCKAAGWDIAITDNGPVVVEINDSWDATGQYFIQKGWRNEIRDCYFAWKKENSIYSNRIACNLTEKQKNKFI